jgi:beta-1,4-mannosyltransferase
MTTVGAPVPSTVGSTPQSVPVVAEVPRADAPYALRPPTLVALTVAFGLTVLVSNAWFDEHTQPLGWALTFVWSLPVVWVAMSVYGLLRTRRCLDLPDGVVAAHSDLLIVVVPTVGNSATFPALCRSVASFSTYLPAYFSLFRVDVVIDEGCPCQTAVQAMVDADPYARLVVVPADYATERGTRFKARATHYAHELRRAEGEAREDVWVLHMDDDTAIGLDTAREMARFIHQQRNIARPKHLAQGVLTYPRQFAVNYWTWLADSVRAADDLARFSAFTGSGTPWAGLHGELLLIRASVEAAIGWDYGPDAIVEDTEFAMRFCARYPARSGWFPARSYGASPATVRDLIRQRRRWAGGLVALTFRRGIPLKGRLLVGYCMSTWVLGPLQHVAFVLLLGVAIQNPSTSPASRWVLLLWGANLAYVVWMYWEGLKVNSRSSGRPRPHPRDQLLVLLLIAVASLWEGVGGLLGLVDFLRGRANRFVVIEKPL